MTPLPRGLPGVPFQSCPALSWAKMAGPALVPASSSGTVSPDVMPEVVAASRVSASLNNSG